jgi:uncharacterized membrane protein YhiD involved in acid resistance
MPFQTDLNLTQTILSEANIRLFINLIVGGLLSMFVRELYRRFSRSLSNRESFSAIFIPLTVTTVLVINTVKSSLALSLGLVGALSIVRFRAAIKDPEELVYLFFCIAIGLTLGAGFTAEAFSGLVIFTIFIIYLHHRGVGGRRGQHNLLLTITGHKDVFFGDDVAQFQKLIDEIVGPYQIQRFEHDRGQIQFRATISPTSEKEITTIMANLQEKLPNCEISYLNLHNLL